MTLIKWRATRNSERMALQRHALWFLLEWRNGRALIRSHDCRDLRWIDRAQVISET